MAEVSKSFKGQLLLDSGLLNGSFFHRTVVLICQHDSEGAFGLVLNRTTNNKLGDLLVEDIPDSLRDQPMHVGGPVQATALSYLHTDSFVPDANVISNLSLGHSLESLVEIGESFSSSNQIKIFTGYAGWGAGQLEEEIQRRAWISHDAAINLVFTKDPENLWRHILREKGGMYTLLAQSPDDLSTN